MLVTPEYAKKAHRVFMKQLKGHKRGLNIYVFN